MLWFKKTLPKSEIIPKSLYDSIITNYLLPIRTQCFASFFFMHTTMDRNILPTLHAIYFSRNKLGAIQGIYKFLDASYRRSHRQVRLWRNARHVLHLRKPIAG